MFTFVNTEKHSSDNQWMHRRKQMTLISRKTVSLFLLLFAVLLFMVPGSSFAAAENNTEISESTNVQLAEGVVKRFSQDQQSLVLQLKNREKITIQLDWNTSLVGYSSPQEIEKQHKVKVWYSSDGQQMTAVKIEKKLMVGC